MEAHLELARGDTATAQEKMEALFVNGDSLETPGRHGIVRLMAWAEIMATLGDVEGAIEQYARLDDEYAADVRSPALHVRSFAERAALYQRLGRSDEAIAMYEKFIDAWQQADPDIQPLVDRARTAITEMREDPTRR